MDMMGKYYFVWEGAVYCGYYKLIKEVIIIFRNPCDLSKKMARKCGICFFSELTMGTWKACTILNKAIGCDIMLSVYNRYGSGLNI